MFIVADLVSLRNWAIFVCPESNLVSDYVDNREKSQSHRQQVVYAGLLIRSYQNFIGTFGICLPYFLTLSGRFMQVTVDEITTKLHFTKASLV